MEKKEKQENDIDKKIDELKKMGCYCDGIIRPYNMPNPLWFYECEEDDYNDSYIKIETHNNTDIFNFLVKIDFVTKKTMDTIFVYE